MKQMLAAAALAALAVTSIAAAGRWPHGAQTTVAKPPPVGPNGSDPFLWLENKNGARALAWVREQNARSLPVLEGDPHYRRFYAQALAIAQSNARIPTPRFLRGEIYNFWQDAHHVRGIWRRTTLRSYRTASPQWTTVLDLDALAAREHANWVWKGADCEEPQERYCMISLSNGGEDAVTMREFDLVTRRFVRNGFVLPRAKQNTAWIDPSTLLVARPWTPDEVTASGYPYVVKILERGQPLSTATEVFRGKPSDVFVFTMELDDGQGHHAVLVSRGITFFTSELYLVNGDRVTKLDVPLKADVAGLSHGRLLLSLNEPWAVGSKTFPEGAVVSFDLAHAAAHPDDLHPQLVFSRGPRDSSPDVFTTKNDLVLVVYHNVRGRAYVYTPSRAGWSRRLLDLPDDASIGVTATNLRDDRLFLDVTGFLTPTTLYLADAANGEPPVEVKALPAQFDASDDVVEQHEATSKDGTKIPYFVVRPKHMRFDGENPTVLTAYGGFQISMTPYYSGITGKLWLDRGGVFVLANIRGGGEFGPAWHDAGLKTHRQRIYDDFYAVGRDLVTHHITDPRHLGIVGGSNGGLLMGVEFTQHPEMWNAVEIEVPLLDMLRYEKIEAGASWVGEYGSDSDPAVRAFWEKTSPYQNLRGGVAYPEPFIWTDTRDDRVGPQQARKFAAKLAAMGVPYLYYENTEGGHAAGANLKESAKTAALGWTYFTMKLMK